MTPIAITLGDPAGIGPEIVAATLAAAPAVLLDRLRVYGHRALLEAGAHAMRVTLPDQVPCHAEGPAPTVTPGRPDAATGAAQVAYLEAAIAAARAGEVGAIVTAPISKIWARQAGLEFPGHTELLAARFGVAAVTMAFFGPRLTIALATTHVPLAAVPTALTPERLGTTIRHLHDALRDQLGIAAPRVGVCGLNPHAGEGGLLGDDELRLVAPAIARARAAGIDARGPLVPDAAFRDHAAGATDGLVALYHDQGLIPVKLLDFDQAVNVTLGLPIVRTSPDHGTAYDRAGRGDARATSMQAALARAVQLLDRRASSTPT